MNTGVGFSEILMIALVVVLFFGSKELPRFLREAGRLVGQARKYTDRVRRELDELARPLEEVKASVTSSFQRKKDLRTQFMVARKALTDDERALKSSTIVGHLKALPEFRDARVVMVYVATGAEVQTDALIRDILKEGKRVVVPYCRTSSTELGIGWIEDVDRDLAPGEFGIREPVKERRDNFYRSDLGLVLCPGVAFDRAGGRLGRGKGYYDKFLAELRGRIPIIGLAFDCQILPEPVPFDYHDVPMTEIVTESGLLLRREAPAASAPVTDAPAG